jgi:GNAT superfamily N-acetyltransferase
MNIKIVPLIRSINRKDFDCGIEELNLYLKQFALPNDKKNIGKTFIALTEDSPVQTAGYYTISMAQVTFDNWPDSLKKGLPRYPIPAMRIGKLAIDLHFQGQGLGALLLRDVFLKAVNISSAVGVHSIIVDAFNETAKSFYLKYGFTPFANEPLTLALPLDTIKQALA